MAESFKPAVEGETFGTGRLYQKLKILEMQN